MPKRTVCITSGASLCVQDCALLVESKTGTAKIPIEDIWVLILESHHVQVTTALLAALADAGIGVMICDKTHHPNGLLLPIGAHSRHAAIVEDQLAISKPLAKQLWKRVVEAKIANQAKVLRLLNNPTLAREITEIGKQVCSGDSTNREAVAACKYFRRLIDCGTRRESSYTAVLDYGYGVLRAGIARTAVAGGWLVSRGIHHSSDLNAFNLVDDLIEPFRPLLDLIVFQPDFENELNHEIKMELTKIFEYKVDMGGKLHTVQTAIEAMFDSFKQAVLEKNAELLVLPGIIPLATYGEADK